jgi:predicted unusual protein kinase regulating ubiquinone biosynthesis (AarF/ABC1/UbiB family)
MDKKTQKSIPTSKVKRAAKVVGAGAKVGGNYIKYYAKKAFNAEHTMDELHKDNAEDIYDTLSELKGSALKVAQMMSMDQQVLPKAYQDKFSLSQYSAPPLSYPLIVKTFTSHFGEKPEVLFDSFTKDAVHAASIGQVHKAQKEGQTFAVKIQYPGVADAITSDLKLIKPLAARLFNMKSSDLDMYLDEVAAKLLEETDYELELERGSFLIQQLQRLNNVVFPTYHKAYSSSRVLTMDWINGDLLSDFIKQEKNQDKRQLIGQTLWDLFLFQFFELKMVHADPHPGNFIVTPENKLGVIDFGCIKEIPDDFATSYYQLLLKETLKDESKLDKLYEEIGLFKPEDSQKEKEKLKAVYFRMITLLGRPFHSKHFDFSDAKYFKEIAQVGDELSRDPELRKMNNARGSKHAIYVMRTFFGLYNLLHQLRVNVELNYTITEQ